MRSKNLIAGILFLPFLIAFKPVDDRIVLIQRGSAPSFEALYELDVTPCFRGDGWLFAGATLQTVGLAEQRGFRIEIIDSDPWSEPYYLLKRSPGELPSRLPDSFREIAAVPEGSIVKGPVEDSEKLAERGVRGIRIRDRRIPLAAEEVSRFIKGGRPGVDRTVRSVVDDVSDSTITEYITRLVDFRTRFSCTDSVEAAGEWIHDIFTGFGYTDVSFDSFPIDSWVPCDIQRNVVAVKPGALDPDKIIVVGGHYDSYTMSYFGCSPDTLAPGADDDASGTVATLEAARVLFEVDTEKTLIFVAFGGEEQWMWGSYDFAEGTYGAGMDIVLMINLDMVANLNDEYWDIDLWGDPGSIPFAQVMAAMAESHTDLVPVVRQGLYPGDAIPFWEYGYRAVYAAEADDSPNYHMCTDTVENISIPYLTDVTRMTVASILFVSETPGVPTGFHAVNVGDGTSLYLAWDPNDEVDIAGYYVHYGTQPGIYDSTKTVASPGDTLQNLQEGTTYYLALSAVDTDSNESFFTEEIEIATASRPSRPAGVTSTSNIAAVVIDWTGNEELDLAGYNIHRWEVGGVQDTVCQAFIPAPASTFTDDLVEPHILYGYFLTAQDDQDPQNESDPSENVYGRLTTMDMGVLVVDNTQDGTGSPFSPTDEMVDLFYSGLLRDYDIGGIWDAGDSAAVGRYLMDYDAGIYSVVLWHSDVRFGRLAGTDTTTMRKYLAVGGNLWLTGWQVLSLLEGGSDPYYTFEEDDFVSRFAGIDSALTTLSADKDFIGAESLEAGFPSISTDSAKVFPIGALYNVEVLLPPFSGADPIYAYVSSDSATSDYHGLPVAVRSRSTDHGLVLTDFPLYFMDPGEARTLTDAVMEFFGEPASAGGDGEGVSLPRVHSLYQNYPNPFNPSTTIAVDIPAAGGDPAAAQMVMLAIYDLRGRKVRILIDGELRPGRYTIHWDGRDDRGRPVGSGIYLYRLESGDFTSTRKMLLIR